MTIIRVDGRLVKRDKPGIIVDTPEGRFRDRRVEIYTSEDSIPPRQLVATVIQREPGEEGPNGARVWIEVYDDSEVK